MRDVGLGTAWAVPSGCRIATMLAGVGKRHSSSDEGNPVTATPPVLAGCPSVPSLVPGLRQCPPSPSVLTLCIPARAEGAGEGAGLAGHDLAHTRCAAGRDSPAAPGAAR